MEIKLFYFTSQLFSNIVKPKPDTIVYLFKKNLLLLLIWLPVFSFAHQYSIESFNIDNGLAQSQVVSMFQDSKGNLWIATYGGASKYDGINFWNFTAKNGLLTDKIYSITEDKTGNIYFATESGLFVYNGKNFDTLTTKDGLSSNVIYKLYRDRNNNIWIGTNNGVTLYDGKKFQIVSPATFSQKIVWAVFEDNEGNIWLGTADNGVFRLDKNYQIANYTTEDGLGSNRVWDVFEDRNKNILLATASDVSKYSKGRISSFTGNLLKDQSIFSLTQDEDGNYWFGSRTNGAIKFNGQTIEYISDKEGMTNLTVKCLLVDREGNLWMGTFGGGMYKVKSKAFYSLGTKDGLLDNTVWTISKNSSGEVFFGTNKGVNVFDGKNIKTINSNYLNRPVWAMLKTTDNILWFGTNGNGLIKYEAGKIIPIGEKEGVESNRITFLYEDKKNNLWIGTYTNGVYKYDGRKFINYTSKDGLNEGDVRSIIGDVSENIWVITSKGISRLVGDGFADIANKDNGLHSENINCGLSDRYGNIILGGANGFQIYNPSTGKHSILNTDNGLIDDAVSFLIFDDYENLWIGTNRGIDKFFYKRYIQDKSVNFKHYGKEEGFNGMECIPNGAYKDESGYLWFGSVMGVYKFLPENDKSNTSVPITIIQEVKLNYQSVDWTKYTDSISPISQLPVNLELPWEDNNLSFEFIGISLTYPDKVRYQFKLDGYDKTWQPIGIKREATYTNLPPGDYAFQVRAANNEGKWHKIPTSFSFKIKKPIWQENWFYVSAVFILMLIIFSIIRIRTRTLLAQRKLLENEVEKKTVELRKAKERAEDSEKAKQEFLANMSHEIRTPMNAVLGMTTLLMKTPLNEKQQKFVNTIKFSSDNLLYIINDILDLSKIEAGKIEFESVSFNLHELIHNLLDMMEVRATEKNLKLVENIDGNVPSFVMGDPVRVNQVMLNLLSNAIKFTNSGSVTLHCEMLEEKGEELILKISVTDTGIGISNEKIDSIFESFTQAQSDITRKYGGTGLGLTITKKLVELQGGKIFVTSKTGEGSTFAFTIRFKKSNEISQEKNIPVEKEDVVLKNKKIKILLVDDNSFNQMVATDLITDWNPDAEIETADNGKIAVEKAEKNNYDIILMDVQMPEMDGYTATGIIRNFASPKAKIPIIAMTAHAIESEIKKCKESGMNEYISKPIEPQKLFSKIAKLLNNHST